MSLKLLSSTELASKGVSAHSLPMLRCPLPLIGELYTSRSVRLANGSERPLAVYIPREEGDLVYSLVRHIEPDVTVEIGMANGFSTLFIAQALQDSGHGTHIAIDPYQQSSWGGAGLTALRRAGLDSLVRLIEKPSHQALPELEQEGVVIQFAFIDGSHLFDYVMSDFLCADRILAVGGYLAFDDSDWLSVLKVIRFAITNRHYQVAFPQVVVEDPCYRPTFLGEWARALGRAFPLLGKKLSPDFLKPGYQLGIRGRCVILRKLAEDDRNGQTRCFVEF
jgi:predicted O-methyltransferase YrrM